MADAIVLRVNDLARSRGSYGARDKERRPVSAVGRPARPCLCEAVVRQLSSEPMTSFTIGNP